MSFARHGRRTVSHTWCVVAMPFTPQLPVTLPPFDNLFLCPLILEAGGACEAFCIPYRAVVKRAQCALSECLVLEVRVVLSLVAAVGYTGKRFASADRKGEIRLWDPTKGQQQGQPLTAHKQWVTSLAWEPLHRNSAGERLASSSKDALIKVKFSLL